MSKRVRRHLVRTYVRMLKNPRVAQDRKEQKVSAAERGGLAQAELGDRPNDRRMDADTEYCVGCGSHTKAEL